MFIAEKVRRLSRWIPRLPALGPQAERSAKPQRRRRSRSLLLEPLEQRALLSVTTIANEWKDVTFVGSGTVKGSFSEDWVRGSYSGSMTDIHATMHYTSNTEGTLVEGTSGGTGNGKWSARSPLGNMSGTWTVQGHAASLTDTNGALAGVGVADSFTLNPAVIDPGVEGGAYEMTGTFDTKTFKIHADFPTGQFNGTVRDASTVPFDVVVTADWGDGKVDVEVDVPGPVQKAKSHTTPVTNIEVYWANGTKKMGKAIDQIPVYWNEASGQYEITDLPTAPAGATSLLLSVKVGKQTKATSLALPTATVATEPVNEGNGLLGEPAATADFTVTLSEPAVQDVIVSYTTVKGKANKADGTQGATPGVDYGDPLKKNKEVTGSIVIPAGQTEGVIQIPILGDTTYEAKETFSVKITKVQGAGIEKANSQVLGTITNDDAKPVINIADSWVNEPAKGTAKMVFEVTLANASYQKIQVQYQTQDGTAKAGEDYSAKKGMLTFQPGQTTATFAITVKIDKETEDQSFFVNLTLVGTPDAELGDGQAEGTIIDNAPPASVAASRDAALGQLAAYSQDFRQGQSDDDNAATDSALAVL